MRYTVSGTGLDITCDVFDMVQWIAKASVQNSLRNIKQSVL